MNIKIRRFKNGDELEIEKLINKSLTEINIKDYEKETLEKLKKTHNKETIIERANNSHMYVLCDNDKVVGVGSIAPYWDSKTESIILTAFIDPDYKNKGLGRKIIETLEKDEYFITADRVEIPASITALEFYRHMGYGFKKNGNFIGKSNEYRLEKFPKINKNNNDTTIYNIRPFINNKYHNYDEFIYQCKKTSLSKVRRRKLGTMG